MELVYDVHHAAAVVEALPEHQRHPLQRALQRVVEEAQASHCWLQGQQEVY